MSRIYLSPPHMSGTELELVHEVFASNWIAPLGPQVEAFEREMAGRLGVPHALALASGTGALHLALLVLGVGPGDEVLCSTLTFAASAFAITYTGARPVFIDCEAASWNLDPGLLAAELESRAARGQLPKAVIAVDLYGQCADYARILPVCERFGVPLIEDAAEALGATCQGRPAGSFGEFGVLSFNGNKIITTSGGGMLLTRRREHRDRALHLATQARDPAAHYQHSQIGFNYRLSNVLAAIGRGQLRALDERVERRRAINRAYRDGLAGLPGIDFMPEAAWGRSNCWLTCITIDPEPFGADRIGIQAALEALDIESRPVWKPMHLQPVFRDCPILGGPVSERLFDRGLCLPSGTALSGDDQQRIIAAIRAAGRNG